MPPAGRGARYEGVASSESADDSEDLQLEETRGFLPPVMVAQPHPGPGGDGGGQAAAPAAYPFCRSRRSVMAALMCGVWFISYCDRTSVSMAIVEMEKEFGWSESADGVVLAAFFAGYTCTQVLGGFASVWYGGKAVLAVAVGSWSLWTVLTPAATYLGLPALVCCRVLLGAGEGVALPALHHIAARWAPPAERSRFVGLSSSGQYLGTAATLLMGPVVQLWWPAVFLVFGCLGLVWLGFWLPHAADSPAKSRRISAAERAYIERSLPPPLPPGAEVADEKIPWRRVLTEPACLAIYADHFAHNWSGYVGLMWLPKYLVDGLGVSLEQSGIMLLLPFLLPFLGCNLGAVLADHLLAKGWRLVRVRRTMELISSSAICICLGYFVVVKEPSPTVFVVLFSCSQFFASFCLSSYWSNILDIAPRYAAAVVGVSNTIASLPGVFGNLIAGLILETSGSFQLVFAVSFGVQALGCLIYCCYCRGDVVLK
eukprot:SAG22_NODE_2158_length_2918_cov_2.839659_2_plen_485_part_00